MQRTRMPIFIFLYAAFSLWGTNALGDDVKIGTIIKGCDCKKGTNFFMDFEAGGDEKIFLNNTKGMLTFSYKYWAVCARAHEKVIFYEKITSRDQVKTSYSESQNDKNKTINTLPDTKFKQNGIYIFTERPKQPVR